MTPENSTIPGELRPAERTPAEFVYEKLGGRVVVNGQLLSGQLALDYLRNMPPTDFETLQTDLTLLEE